MSQQLNTCPSTRASAKEHQAWLGGKRSLICVFSYRQNFTRRKESSSVTSPPKVGSLCTACGTSSSPSRQAASSWSLLCNEQCSLHSNFSACYGKEGCVSKQTPPNKQSCITSYKLLLSMSYSDLNVGMQPLQTTFHLKLTQKCITDNSQARFSWAEPSLEHNHFLPNKELYCWSSMKQWGQCLVPLLVGSGRSTAQQVCLHWVHSWVQPQELLPPMSSMFIGQTEFYLHSSSLKPPKQLPPITSASSSHHMLD